MSKRVILVTVVCLLTSLTCPAQDVWVSTAGSNANSGTKASPWRTVTFAAAHAPAGATVHIAAGTYGTAGFLEGIEVKGGRKLVFAGEGIGKTVIRANRGFQRTIPYRTGTRTWSGVFIAHGAGTGVDLRDLTLDAMHLQPAFLACAVYTDGAGGTVDRVEMANAGASPANGAQGHLGFLAIGKNTANPSSVHLKDCWIHDWNKVGVVLGGEGLTGSISGCTIVGSGFLGAGKAAQNGIQLGSGGGGFVVRNNVVRNVWYTPSRWNAVGILVYDTRDATPNIITGNRILTCKTAYYLYTPTSGTTRFDGNRTGDCHWGINVWSKGGSARDNRFDAFQSIYVVSAPSFPIAHNSYSDFRTNPGWPTRYIAGGNSSIQDLTPNTSCLGFRDRVDVKLAPLAGPMQIVVADFNNDKKPDFASANATVNTVSVHFGSGGTDFTTIPARSVAVPGGPSFLATGELDGRPGVDLAVVTNDGNVYVLANNGTGTFTRGTPFDLDGTKNDARPSSIASGQLDGQFEDDLVVGFVGDRVFKNGGVLVLRVKAGALTKGAAVPGTVRSIRGVALGDFNQDGRLDLAATDESNNIGRSDKLEVWLQATVPGTFTAPVGYTIGPVGRGLALGDLDGDKDLDIAVASAAQPGEIRVFVGDRKDGSFREAAESPFRVDADATGVAILDLQDDGDPDTARMDVAVVHMSRRKVARLVDFTRGGFADFLGCPTGLDPTSIAFADLDGDRLPDLLVANRGDSKVTVRLARPDPLAISFGTGCPGTDGKVPRIFGAGLPRLGNAGFAVGVQNVRGWSLGVLLLGADRRASAACRLLVGTLFFTTTAFTNGQGTGTTPLPVPNLPALTGINFFGQWVIFDSGGRFLGDFALSDGLRLRTGE